MSKSKKTKTRIMPISFYVNMAKKCAARHKESIEAYVKRHVAFYKKEIAHARTKSRRADYIRYLNSQKRVARHLHIKLS